MNNRLINTKVAGGGGGCTDIVDNYDPFGGNGVALYQLNGDATDVSGNYNGTATNVTYGTGVFGQAGVFNGSSSKITTNADFDGGTTQGGTISFWFKTSSTSTQVAIGSQTSLNGSAYGSDIFVGATTSVYADESLAFWHYDGANTYAMFVREGHTAYQNGNWFHCVITSTSTTKNIYINGVDKTLSYRSGTTPSTTFSLTNIELGISLGSSDFFNGSIDQVRIFNTALTPLEVEALYTEELCICDGTVDTLDILGDGSCIATYQLDGNANDLSGNYSGTPVGTISYGVGEFDLAGVFNGSTKILTPINTTNFVSNLNDRTVDFSISLWINPSVIPSTGEDLVFYIGNYTTISPQYHTIQLQLKLGSLRFSIYEGVTEHIISTSSLVVGNWYNVVCIRESSVMKLYVNNSLIGQTTQTNNSSISSSTNLQFGDVQSAGAYYNGLLDQVRFFNKALSAGEVTTLYNETACTKAACTGTTNTLDILGDSSCVATYPLDGSPADLSGNYNGVQTNVTYPQGYFDLGGNFNASNSNVIIQGLPALSTFTLSFWIKQPNPSGNNFAIMHFYDFAGGAGVNNNFIYGGDRLSFFPYNAASDNAMQLNQTTTLSEVFNGNWNHVVLTTEGTFTTTKLYINSNLRALDDFSLTDSSIRLTNYLSIGIRGDGYQYPNKRLNELDQIRIFNKALSAGEVTTLYNETPCN